MPAINATTTSLSNATLTNVTSQALQVVCAWPVSGQYGPGSRVLYYILVAACVFARKAEWLRNACLAAALLFPAVAALHGIVLAAVHVNGAVDMDVFGAFQLCSIGILAAPVTVRLSKTYFDAPGRNIIFLWTGLILAGLLSLTVEFFRIHAHDCTHDDQGRPVFFTRGNFTYGNPAICGIICDPEDPLSPTSPMRGGSQDNIYLIPTPDKLTFGTATLLASACCIPAILYLVFMWFKILEINWKIRWGHKEEDSLNEVIEGTNGATVGTMKGINSLVSQFLSAVEVPLFAAAVLLIVVFGERNFFSRQVQYQSEPIQSIGQWAPLVGTGLAVFGSLYLLLATGLEAEGKEKPVTSPHHHCNCSTHGIQERASTSSSSDSIATPEAAEMRPSSDMRFSNEIVPTISQKSRGSDVGGRRTVAKTLTKIGEYMGNAAPDRFDDSEFKTGRAVNFPELPGEEHRNIALPQIREQFNTYNENALPILRESRSRSRSNSFNSRLSPDPPSPITRSPSPRRSTLDTPMRSPSGGRSVSPGPRRSTLEVVTTPTLRSPSLRRNTLEVPSGGRHRRGASDPPVVVLSPVEAGDDSSFPPVFDSPPSTPPAS